MYQKLEAKLHDVFWNAEAPDVELELIKKHLAGSSGRSLEIGCGSGRILLPLIDAGYAVDGNDVSRDMLDLLEGERDGREFQAFHGDTLDQAIEPYQHFLIPAFTLMLFEEGKVQETLEYIAKKAQQGATLYATTFMPWAEICGELEEDEWYKDHDAESSEGAKAVCRTKFTIDRTYQKLKRTHRYTYRTRDGKKELQESEQVLRWYTFMEMSSLLENAGWQVEKTIFDLNVEEDSTNAHLYTFEATLR